MKKLFTAALAVCVLAGGLLILNDTDFIDLHDLSLGNVSADLSPEKAAEYTPKTVDIPLRKVSVSELEQNGVELNDCLMLVNGSHTLPEGYEPHLTYYKEVPFEKHTCDAYQALSEAVSQQCGEKLYISSSYRTAEEQEKLYNEEGSDTAQLPNASEHRTGMALDVYVQYYAGKGFIKCDAGKWVNAHCADYGFIIRYPKGKKKITGISYEPWHLRYVGKPHAEIMTQLGLTLEEYAGIYEDGVFCEYGGYVIAHETSDELMLPENAAECSVSPDGCGGYFVTAKLG